MVLDDSNIQAQVNDWIANPDGHTYGIISNWDVSGVTDMSELFMNKMTFNDDISSWDVSLVTDMSSMFEGALAFDQNISTWDVSAVTSHTNFGTNSGLSESYYPTGFYSNSGAMDDVNIQTAVDLWISDRTTAEQTYGHISNWDVSGVTNMSELFMNKSTFDQDLSGWDVSLVTDMSSMFKGAHAFNNKSNGDVFYPNSTSSVTNMSSMFEGALAFDQNISTWDVSFVTSHTDFGTNSGLSESNYPIGFYSNPSAGGDPYITTISGLTYKMDDFTGFARMLQGQLDGKLFTLNSQTKLLSGDEITELIVWRKENLGVRQFEKNATFASFPAYFNKVYVSWGEESFIINVNTLEIEFSNYDVDISREYEIVKEYVWSNKSSSASIAKIKIGNTILIIKSYDNKDIRNGFTICNAPNIKNRSGALEHAIYTEDMQIPGIMYTGAITQTSNREQHKNTVKEEFLEEGIKRKLEMNVY